MTDTTQSKSEDFRPMARLSFPEFGTPIFRKFCEMPYICKSVGPTFMSLSMSSPSHVSQLNFGSAQSFIAIPGVSTTVKLPWLASHLSLGLASSHQLEIADVKDHYALDDDELLPLSEVITHMHNGVHLGFDLSTQRHGRIAVLRKDNDTEMLVSTPNVKLPIAGADGHDFVFGFQLKSSRVPPKHPQWVPPKFAVGFMSSLPLDSMRVPRIPGVSQDPGIVFKIDSDLEVDVLVETPIVRKPNIFPFYQRDLCVGASVGHNLQSLHASRFRYGLYVTYGLASVSYSNRHGVGVLGVELGIGGSTNAAPRFAQSQVAPIDEYP